MPQIGGIRMSGKGSKPRPFSVDRKVFESNWDKIFAVKQSHQDAPTDEEKSKKKEQAQDPRNG